MPLNDVVHQGKPSCYIQYGWSLSDVTQETGAVLDSALMEQTLMVEKNENPQWNQQVLFHNPMNQTSYDRGFFVIQIRDFNRIEPIDVICIPMSVIQPYKTYHLEIKAKHKKNLSQEYRVLTSITLEVPYYAQEEKMMAVVINSLKFDKIPTMPVQRFCAVLTTNNTSIDKLTHLPIDASESTENNKQVLKFSNQTAPIFKTTWMNIPPVRTNNQFNALAAFILPQSAIGKGMQIFLMFNNGQSSSLMPVEVQSQTAKLDDKLSKCLDAPTNSPFELPLAVGVHGKKPDTFKGVEITGIFQAVPLDPRNL